MCDVERENEKEAGEVRRVKVVKGLVNCVKELQLNPEHNRESLKGFKKGGATNRFSF